MKITIAAVGRIRAPFADDQQHYLKLLGIAQPVEVVEVRDDAALVRRLPANAHVTAVDGGGRALDSAAWARWLDGRRREGRPVWLLVGGPEGLPAAALNASAERISLGPQTMAHQLARVVVLEQLYRAADILAGGNYHR